MKGARSAWFLSSSEPSPRQSGGEEAPDGCGNLVGVCLKCEVAGVEQSDVCAGDITLEGLSARRQEKWVVAAPDGQQRRLALPKVFLKPGIKLDVGRVVEEQIQLDFVRAWPCQVVVIKRVAVRRHQRRVGYPVGVLPDRRFRPDQAADRVAVGLGGFLPVLPDGVPAVTEAFLIGVPVLCDDRGD